MDRFKHRGYRHASVWIGAGVVGLCAVFYARLIAVAQLWYYRWFSGHAVLVSVASPLAFLLATALVKKLAPEAKGSGIPQVLEAIELAKGTNTSESAWRTPLVSLKTAGIKVISSTIGILGGASIGREGPTVQLASSGFAFFGRVARRWIPGLDLQSYLVAGAAAGVAAAFNTPLAGITFALEEIAEGSLGPYRQMMMLAVIISGITAQALLGDYLYFGQPTIGKPDFWILPISLALGLFGGLGGGFFAKLLAHPEKLRLPTVWWQNALICGSVCALIGYATHGATSGSGYEVAHDALSEATADNASLLYPFLKFVTTVLSYLSGMAGGIFSPCLSIGAGLGITFAKLIHFADFKSCALIGMVAFFSGAVQAPLTAVIIVTEMTNEHIVILPFMIAAFLANGLGKWLMPVPLYRFLAEKHEKA